MNFFTSQFKQLLLITCLLLFATMAFTQTRVKESRQYKVFSRMANHANAVFSLPEGFKELSVKNENSNFDYGITIPGQEFEIWFKISPQTDADPDSLYVGIGKNEAKALAGENDYFTRGIPDEVLNDYNADAGRTYLINLPDAAATKHYKFALLITLQKNHRGTIMAVCFTNEKGPDFFKNINRAKSCIKFRSAN